MNAESPRLKEAGDGCAGPEEASPALSKTGHFRIVGTDKTNCHSSATEHREAGLDRLPFSLNEGTVLVRHLVEQSFTVVYYRRAIFNAVVRKEFLVSSFEST